MAIQAGLTGPPLVPDLRLRVWSDQPGDDVVVRLDKTGALLAGATLVRGRVPPDVAAAPGLPRRVVEIGGLPPDTRVRVVMGNEACSVLTPPAPDGELRLLVGSCFYQPDDRGQLASAYVNLREQDLPHVRLHGGDQLYLDAGRLPNGPTALARTLARYRQYWGDPGYARYLRSGISLFTPDDHDYWNDYPFPMPHLTRSKDGEWRAHAEAARLAYAAYQALGHPEGRTWFSLDLGVVSLFVLDTRTRRGSKDRNPPPRLFDDTQREALLDWSRNLQKPGLLLSAMPLFQKAAGKVLFFTADHNLLSWPSDARHIWRAVEKAPYSVLVLAGDIHHGVVSEWRTGSPGAVRQHYEVVSSPLRLLGWPTRSERQASRQPGGLQLGEELGRRDVTRTAFATSTDHFTLLRLRREAQSVRVNASVHRVPDASIPRSEVDHTHPCQVEFHLRREA